MKTRIPDVTTEDILRVVSYDPDSGFFTWKRRFPQAGEDPAKVAAWNTRYVGRRAGSVFKRGYRVLEIKSRKITEHRVAIKLITGHWPAQDVDHINGVRDDNRAANLRCVSRSQNLQNTTKLRRNNTSGVKGVSYIPKEKKWIVRIREFKGKTAGGAYLGRYRYFGRFDSLEEASAVASRARSILHGEFAKHVDLSTPTT